ncbi:MAG TPA: Zn-dependent exopeptidase M28 [Treponema sp.]|nr:Zn-dependent exopeptidase M28 [Treponema sp.]
MDYSISLQKHMRMLCKTIGARPAGSAKNKAAVDYVAGVLRQCGLEVRLQEFDCMDWKNFGAVLRVDGCDVPVTASEYSLPCEIEAELCCVDSVEALQNAELTGKIAVMHGDLCKEPLMPKNFQFYNPGEHKQIIALLEEKNPAAIITAAPTKDHIIADGDFNIPCAIVSAEQLDVFKQSASRRAKLTINAERIPSKAHNVIAAYGKQSEKVCFSAHIDTKPTTPGALDNASGVSALLTFAESLSGKEFPFQIEIVLFNGEDYYSTPGEIAFMSSLSTEYRLAVNVDGIGLKNSATSVSFYSCAPEIENRIMKRVEQTTGIERIDPWPMGDHMLFASCGIPTVAITASDIFSLMGSVLHSPDDNMEKIDIDILSSTARFLESCADGWERDKDIFTKS